MKTTITLSDFRYNFYRSERKEQFSYDALGAIFEHLEEMDCELELDIIAICCDFTEYEDINEVKKEYDFIDDLEELKEHTLVLELEKGGLVIQNF